MSRKFSENSDEKNTRKHCQMYSKQEQLWRWPFDSTNLKRMLLTDSCSHPAGCLRNAVRKYFAWIENIIGVK